MSIRQNLAYQAIDRHIEEGHGDDIAITFVDEGVISRYSYHWLKSETDLWGAKLKELGVKKGDLVYTFFPKHLDGHVALLSVVKIGAVAVPLFESFMEEALYDRMEDGGGSVILTHAEFVDRIPSERLSQHVTVLVTNTKQDGDTFRSFSSITATSTDGVIEAVSTDDPLNIHYTSGSTGKPKGIVHAHRVVSLQRKTGREVLAIHPKTVYWCTAHLGWVTGTVYGAFAPFLNRANVVIVNGRFSPEGWYEAIEQVGIEVWYSAPTAFRLLMAASPEVLEAYDLSSLREIASVGEPLNPEIVTWGRREYGLTIRDTWWMTETGSQMIVNLPGDEVRLGSMGKPLPWVTVAILDDNGEVLPRGELGHLAIKSPWESMMKEVWNNPEKYQSYFALHKDWYLSGDLAVQDQDGYVYFQGRSDDMINSSGERIGPFEVESRLIEHPAVAEAGVVGKPDPVRGEIVKAFLVLNESYQNQNPDQLLKEIRQFVKETLSPHAAPRELEILSELPKTAISGKILRRELKKRDIAIEVS